MANDGRQAPGFDLLQLTLRFNTGLILLTPFSISSTVHDKTLSPLITLYEFFRVRVLVVEPFLGYVIWCAGIVVDTVVTCWCFCFGKERKQI